MSDAAKGWQEGWNPHWAGFRFSGVETHAVFDLARCGGVAVQSGGGASV